MPLIPNFTVLQVIGTPSTLTFTDVSSGIDASVTNRRIYIQTANGNYLVISNTTTNYFLWDLGDITKVFELLNKDYAVSIKVDWVDVGGNIIYTKTIDAIFTQYLEIFHYGLTKYQASNKSITQNANYYNNKSKLWQHIVSAKNAMLLYGDIAGSQDELDAGWNMVINEKSYF